MATMKTSWGIEVGADSVKAIRLEREGDRVAVSDFAVIPHRKVLTTPDLDQDEVVRLSLGQLISQKSLEGEHLVMSVPGHAAFARFAKLPPVEPKKVPDIVKFEAVQQIPFPIDEVEWDYQTFTSDESPEVEVGIFAITRDRVQQRLGIYAELGISPESLTLSPVALYNAMAYDLSLVKSPKPVIFLDIGTQATDVIIAEKGRCWIRTFPLGGTHFTEAIANAFKLSYAKADKLKKEASTSKYTKQIMQAMRPVFSDLLQDLQRSIGYYQSLHRDDDLTQMVGIGSTFKIPGLRKFIGQQLQINVVRLDEYKRVTVTGRQAASFAEHTVNMGTAYGLALQGVGLAPIDVNLVPVKALREQMWHAKTKWFAAAAAIIVVGAATSLYHPLKDGGQLDPTSPQIVANVLERGGRLRDQLDEAKTTSQVGFEAENLRRLTDLRRVWPYLINDVADALASSGPDPIELGSDAASIRGLSPGARSLVALRSLSGEYNAPVAADGQPDQPPKRTILVTMHVSFSNRGKIAFLNDTVKQWLFDNADPVGTRADVPYRILVDSITTNRTQLDEFKVDDDGKEEAMSGSGAGAGRPKAPLKKPNESRRQNPPSRGAPGSGAGATKPGGFGLGGAGASRRQAPTKKRRAPGSGFGLGGAAGEGATPPPAGGSGRSFGGTSRDSAGSSRSGGSTGDRKVQGDLDNLAPLPGRPGLLEPGSKYYRVPIQFEIEIIDPTEKPAPDKTAQRPGGSNNEGSGA